MVGNTLETAVNTGKTYLQKTFNLFENNVKAINQNQVRKQLKDALNADKFTSYASEFEKKDVSQKLIDSFLNKVKTGTNKGLEEARVAWRAEMENAQGKLSEGKNTFHRAIKDVISDTLPTEKKALYNQYKEKMAKLYDIREILRAKVEASTETLSLLEKGIKITGIAGAAEGLKRIITGHW